MKRMRLTTAGRVVIFILVATLICGIGFFAYQYVAPALAETLNLDANAPEHHQTPNPVAGNNKPAKGSPTKATADKPEINLSLDEWIGYEPLLHANGGFETQKGSIWDKLGIKVNIHIINDAEASSNALIKGDLDAAGYTLNRTVFLSNKFSNAGVDVIMPVFTNYSNGGDGIIATNAINSVEDLIDARIGVPKHSEAQSLVVWFVNKSDLSEDQKRQIIDNMVLLNDAEQTGLSFFANSLDVAATWQPYLSYAEESTSSHILFDTTSSNKLIMSGVVFRKDFAENNREVVEKFIEGIFLAIEDYESDFDTIRKMMPMFADMSDDDIRIMRHDASMVDYAGNINALDNDSHVVFADMCDVWESVGETVNRSLDATLFDDSFVKALSDKYSSIPVAQKPVFEITDEQKEAALDVPSMLTKSCTIEFHPDTAKFLDGAAAAETLNEFVEIAKVLDGTIIQIEGNVNFDGHIYSGDALSTSRAKAVKDYFVACGIDPNRIIVIGNGNSKMIADPAGSIDETMRNRRTDIFFKTIGA